LKEPNAGKRKKLVSRFLKEDVDKGCEEGKKRQAGEIKKLKAAKRTNRDGSEGDPVRENLQRGSKDQKPNARA